MDTATGTLISSALEYRGESFPNISDIGGDLGPSYFTLFSVGYWDVVEVVLQTGSLQGYRGGPFYMDFWGYPAYPAGGFSETYGVLTDVSQPSSVTPEAPGLLLLGTGLLGAIGVARGRTYPRLLGTSVKTSEVQFHHDV